MLNSNAGIDQTVESNPDAATDGNGTWIAVWTTCRALSSPDNPQRFYISRSDDDGVSWSQRALVNGIPAANGEYGVRAVIATDCAGNWMLVAESDNLTSPTTGSDGDLVCFVSKDNGFTWSQPKPVNNWAATDDNGDGMPSVATDGKGTWAVVWQGHNAFGGPPHIGNVFVSVSTDIGDNWTTPTRVNLTPGNSTQGNTLPRISTDGQGTWGVAWELADSQQPGSICFAKSTDNCAIWSEKQVLGTADFQYQPPGLANDTQGNWGVNWWRNSSEVHFTRATIEPPPQAAVMGWEMF